MSGSSTENKDRYRISVVPRCSCTQSLDLQRCLIGTIYKSDTWFACQKERCERHNKYFKINNKPAKISRANLFDRSQRHWHYPMNSNRNYYSAWVITVSNLYATLQWIIVAVSLRLHNFILHLSVCVTPLIDHNMRICHASTGFFAFRRS